MSITPLMIPGLYGSELQHWQTWLERKLPGAVRVEQEDWDNPVLPIWAEKVLHYIDHLPGQVWLIAHSFGCLAGVVAASKRPERIAGAMLVAMADPARFNLQGFRQGELYVAAAGSIASQLPKASFNFPSVVVASTNDPWMSAEKALSWAEIWESRFLNIGEAGHINVASGFGPWPLGLDIFEQLRRAQTDLVQGSINQDIL